MSYSAFFIPIRPNSPDPDYEDLDSGDENASHDDDTKTVGVQFGPLLRNIRCAIWSRTIRFASTAPIFRSSRRGILSGSRHMPIGDRRESFHLISWSCCSSSISRQDANADRHAFGMVLLENNASAINPFSFFLYPCFFCTIPFTPSSTDSALFISQCWSTRPAAS